MKFSDETKQGLSALVDKAVQGGAAIPGAAVVVVGKDGSELFAKAAGTRGAASDEPMTLDNIFWVASCTKMVAGLACMQLVEKGVLRLDDSAQTEGFCPEWQHLKVLAPNGDLVDRTKRITLRMLLTHTAGFGYSFSNERLRNHSLPVGINEFSGDIRDFTQPLLFQPGEGWEYGTSLDWAGLVLERATGVSLDEYIQANICKPLGLEKLGLFLTDDMRRHLVHQNQKAPDGKISQREHVVHRQVAAATAEERKAIVSSAGGGMFANPQDYARIIAVLLNDGTCSRTGAKIVEKATVDQMFTNQIPQFPHFGRQGISAAKPDLTNSIPELYPVPERRPQGWGLTFMLTGGQTGRSENTAWWAGLANSFWWADRDNGVGGIVCTQILPFGDPSVMGLWAQLEIGVYEGLKTATQ